MRGASGLGLATERSRGQGHHQLDRPEQQRWSPIPGAEVRRNDVDLGTKPFPYGRDQRALPAAVHADDRDHAAPSGRATVPDARRVEKKLVQTSDDPEQRPPRAAYPGLG